MIAFTRQLTLFLAFDLGVLPLAWSQCPIVIGLPPAIECVPNSGSPMPGPVNVAALALTTTNSVSRVETPPISKALISPRSKSLVSVPRKKTVAQTYQHLPPIQLLNPTIAGEKTAAVLPAVPKELLGNWNAVGRNASGQLITVELQLDDHGWARLTVPQTTGESLSTTHRIAYDKHTLKLVGPATDILIGKVVDVNHRQMTLEGPAGTVTFVSNNNNRK